MSKDERVEILVDRTKCCGYGLCVEMSPEVYRLDDMGFASVEPGAVPGRWRGQAVEAAESCPEAAISVRALES